MLQPESTTQHLLASGLLGRITFSTRVSKSKACPLLAKLVNWQGASSSDRELCLFSKSASIVELR